jgi:hypothetical protein
MNFPPDTLVNKTASAINAHIRQELGQTHSSIHIPYIVDALQREYVMVLESGIMPSNANVAAVVIEETKKRINSMYTEHSQHAIDSRAYTARPFADDDVDFSKTSFADVMPRGLFENRDPRGSESYREPLNLL